MATGCYTGLGTEEDGYGMDMGYVDLIGMKNYDNVSHNFTHMGAFDHVCKINKWHNVPLYYNQNTALVVSCLESQVLSKNF